MPTIREWIDHYKEYAASDRERIRRALIELRGDEMWKTSYASDIINHLYALDMADTEVTREIRRRIVR